MREKSVVLRAGVALAILACIAVSACDTGGGSSGTGGSSDVDTAVTDSVADGGAAIDAVHLADTAATDTAAADTGPTLDVGSWPDIAADVMTDAGGPPPGPTPSGPVDPGCLDGQYSETLPTPEVSIDSAKSGYNAANLNGFILEVLDLRYPVGAYIVEQALIHGGQLGDCVAYFAYDTSSAQKVIDSLSTVTHECGHFLDIGLGGWTADAYVITDELTLQCEGGDKFEYGGNTFPRSELMNDTYSALRGLCEQGQWGGCDSYADVYLVGDSGDQGFNTLMEEAVQYVNSLATGYAFNDQYTWTVSEKDGIMTFLWYIERYLFLARTQYPSTHSFILGNACFRELILTVWGRAWLYLDVTEPLANLGMEDDVIEALVMAPELLAEIQSVREAHGCQ